VDDVQVTEVPDIERLYREAGDRLWWALLAYTGDREIASDSLAEAFARALGAVESIRDPAAWVWRVAFPVATANLRENRRTIPEPAGTYEIAEEPMAVIHALGKLSQRQRAVFVLFYLEDRPTKDIGQLLGMSPATVSVHLHRARRRLRSILGEDDD
jgi:RNA polymerase sigma-70 factor (ECF subfamily)